MYQFSSRSVKRMEGVHPELRMVFMEAIKISPIDFGIPKDGGVRTAARQKEMFDDPDIKTKCDGIWNISKHQVDGDEFDNTEYGRALDIYAYVNGKASWKIHHLSMAAGIIIGTANRMRKEGKISIEIRWGGEFGSYSFEGWDSGHFEVKE